MNALGRHILVEFIGCNSEILNDVSIIEKSMVDAAQDAGATVINSTFHHFSPFGVSGVVVIQESHLAIHTWPEYQYAAVDLFTCGESVDPWISFDFLKKAFQAQGHSALEMHRGSLSLMKRVPFKVEEGRTEMEQTLVSPKFKRNMWFTDKDENQALSLRYEGDVLFYEKTPFQTVRVFDSCSYGRMLTINNMVMCTERDEFHYHEMITHPALQVLKNPKKVLVIGGGDGGTIREVFKYPSVESVTMVEIDEAVVRASKQFLPTVAKEFGNSKLNLIIGDGIQFVKEKAQSVAAAGGEYDLIIVDGSDPVGPAKGLFSEEFYKNCYASLKSNGILMTQGESPMFHTETFKELAQCLKGVFGKNKLHTLMFHATTYPSGMWSIQMAVKGDVDVKALNAKDTQVFTKEKGLKYYNEELHLSSMVLPTFVKNMLSE